jgi:malonyl-CoA O-methyltransferase
VGCGTGFWSEGLEKVVGIDISQSMLRMYRQKGFLGICAMAEAMPFKDKSFDCVVSNFALHWTSIDQSFREIFRVCRKKFLCAMPVKGSLEPLDFPFLSPEDILERLHHLGGKLRKVELRRLEIPFKGWDLLRFFHYTGSSYNPSKGDILRAKKSVERLIFSIDKPNFLVLFFSCEVPQ